MMTSRTAHDAVSKCVLAAKFVAGRGVEEGQIGVGHQVVQRAHALGGHVNKNASKVMQYKVLSNIKSLGPVRVGKIERQKPSVVGRDQLLDFFVGP